MSGIVEKKQNIAPHLEAYCFQEGDIHFGKRVPGRALPIVSGPAPNVRGFINKVCKKGIFDEGVYPVVESVNEAYKKNQSGAHRVDLLIDWVQELKNQYSSLPLHFYC